MVEACGRTDIPQRVANQKERVGNGIADGSLTQQEVREIRQERRQDRIEARIANGGAPLSPDQLASVLDKSSANIYDKRHNGDVCTA